MDHHPVARSLIPSAYVNLGNGSLIIPQDDCFCLKWLKSKGSTFEQKMANGLQWTAFAMSVIILLYYAYATWKTTCGWEEVYVCCVELTKVIIEFFHEFDEPSMLFLANGNRVQWLRYGEWLLTCPVILIHLSNLTGLKDDYNKRTMQLLVSDIGTIVWGATSAMSQGYVKAIFFILGCIYGANTFFHAAKVYIESYHTVPKGTCRQLVRIMAWLFFFSWTMFPVLFLLGPEGFNHLTVYGSTIGHTVIDIMSKNVWGFLGHYLRLKIHEHILLFGDIRKVQKIKVAGQEMEVETLMSEEGTDTVKKSTAQYANRESFLVMRDRLKEKGFEVRASLDNSAIAEATAAMAAAAGGGGGAPPSKGGTELSKLDGGGGAVDIAAAAAVLSPGRVILAVPDISMVDYFREQFAQLPAPYEVVPALGADNAVQLVGQAAALGGCDFVLLHPEFLRDKGPNNLVVRLRTMGQRVAAFGWSSVGPMRDLIEGSGLDGWLEGPSFGSGINQANMVTLVARMQQARRMAAMVGSGSAMFGSGGSMLMGGGSMMGSAGVSSGLGIGMGMGSIVGMNGVGNMGLAGGGVMSMNSGGLVPQLSASGRAGVGVGGSVGLMRMGSQSHMAAGGSGSGGVQQQGMGSMTNPLFNTAPSPLNSQPGRPEAGAGSAVAAAASGLQHPGSVRNSGIMASSGSGAGQMPMQISGAVAVAPAAPGGGGGVVSEAEMLQQLMAEINRLKSELGE